MSYHHQAVSFPGAGESVVAAESTSSHLQLGRHCFIIFDGCSTWFCSLLESSKLVPPAGHNFIDTVQQ